MSKDAVLESEDEIDMDVRLAPRVALILRRLRTSINEWGGGLLASNSMLAVGAAGVVSDASLSDDEGSCDSESVSSGIAYAV